MGLDWLGQRFFRWVHEQHLVYAACWEDPQADRLAMQLRADDRVLVITSAGCNALDYLLDEPACVCAVDMNYRQNALLELKRAAILALEWPVFFQLFGEGHLPGIQQIYRSRLRSQLTEQYQAYWDRWITLFCGRQSFYFRTPSGRFAAMFRWYVDHVLRSRSDIEELLEAETIAQQQMIYERRLQKKLWSRPLAWLMRRNWALAMSGIPPQQRGQLLSNSPDLLGYLRSRAEHSISTSLLRHNYFWRVYLTGKFTPACCPRYLQPENFVRLRELLPRLTTHTATVTDFLQSTSRTFSHFVLLDHMDWLAANNSVDLQREWQALIKHADPEAMFLWRSLGLNTEYVDQVQVPVQGKPHRVCELVRYDEALSEQLHAQERVSVYGCVRVARIVGKPKELNKGEGACSDR